MGPRLVDCWPEMSKTWHSTFPRSAIHVDAGRLQDSHGTRQGLSPFGKVSGVRCKFSFATRISLASSGHE